MNQNKKPHHRTNRRAFAELSATYIGKIQYKNISAFLRFIYLLFSKHPSQTREDIDIKLQRSEKAAKHITKEHEKAYSTRTYKYIITL